MRNLKGKENPQSINKRSKKREKQHTHKKQDNVVMNYKSHISLYTK